MECQDSWSITGLEFCNKYLLENMEILDLFQYSGPCTPDLLEHNLTPLFLPFLPCPTPEVTA